MHSPAQPTSQTQPVVAVLGTPASNTYLQAHAELAVRDFLTRRAVNTVMFYMNELGDGPSHQWLSQFDDFSNKVKLRQFRNGDQFIARMLLAPLKEGTVTIGYPSARGLSRTVSFVIEPRRIAQRVIDVRLHLSTEWASDLRCVDADNLELQRLSFERILVSSEQELDTKRNLTFDSDPMATDQTPLRFQNYIALKTLITQHAVARLLPYIRDHGSNHEYMYLLQFMNWYGAIADGDEFIRDLMARQVEQRSNATFTVVPKSIALQLLELRSAIAAEWISVMEFVPMEHEMNARGALEKLFEVSNDLPSDAGN